MTVSTRPPRFPPGDEAATDWFVPLGIAIVALAFVIYFVADDSPFGLGGDGSGDDTQTDSATATSTTTTSATTTATQTGTTSSTASTSTSTTSTSTTSATSTTTQSSTSTTSTTTGPDGHEDVIWPFAQSDAVAGTTYTLLGIWPDAAGPAPQGTMDWARHPSPRIGFWDVAGSSAPTTLGSYQLHADDGSGLAFGPGNYGARLQLYAFDAQGRHAGGIDGPQGSDHLPYATSGFCHLQFDYVTYYMGDGETPAGMTDWPALLEAYRPTLVDLLTGKRPGEAAATPPIAIDPGSDFCGWGSLTLAGRLDDVAAAA